jgi:hypothetical protein
VEVSDADMAARKKAWAAPAPKASSGVLAKYVRLVEVRLGRVCDGLERRAESLEATRPGLARRYDSFATAFLRVLLGGFPGSTVDDRSSLTIEVENLRIPCSSKSMTV